MGLFYLGNPDASNPNVFPKDLLEKVCMDFTCKGRECVRDNCKFLHPCQARGLDRKTVEAIGRNFATTKKG